MFESFMGAWIALVLVALLSLAFSPSAGDVRDACRAHDGVAAYYGGGYLDGKAVIICRDGETVKP